MGLPATGSAGGGRSPELSAFGETRTAQVSPVVQMDAVYGIPATAETFSATGGAVTTTDGNFVCTTGTSAGGYGVVRTRRGVRYRPGQGVVFRWTALFDSANATALSLQAAGAFTSASGFFVGYDGASFGVMHRTDGKHETRSVAITAAATGAETVDLELNGTTYNIPVTSGTAEHNALEIATWLEANQSAWAATQNDDDVVLLNLGVGPTAGAYSFASDGTCAGTISQVEAGVANTETWTYQASWNRDTMDGTGPSSLTLDPSKGNVYQLNLQYLGYGAVVMSVEAPTTGRFVPVHVWEFPNSRTTPTLINPVLKVGWVSASLGSTTNLTVSGASCMGGVDGPLEPFSNPRGYVYQRTGVAATQVSIFAIRVRLVFDGVAQLSEVIPRLASVAPAGTKPCAVEILLNPTFDTAVTEPDWQYVDESTSIVEVDTSGTQLSDKGTIIAAFSVGGGGSRELDFSALGLSGSTPLHLVRGDVLSIAASISGGGGSDVAASLSWLPL